jgi:hypothetical protein
MNVIHYNLIQITMQISDTKVQTDLRHTPVQCPSPDSTVNPGRVVYLLFYAYLSMNLSEKLKIDARDVATFNSSVQE